MVITHQPPGLPPFPNGRLSPGGNLTPQRVTLAVTHLGALRPTGRTDFPLDQLSSQFRGFFRLGWTLGGSPGILG